MRGSKENFAAEKWTIWRKKPSWGRHPAKAHSMKIKLWQWKYDIDKEDTKIMTDGGTPAKLAS